jgi:hypothetical protein
MMNIAFLALGFASLVGAADVADPTPTYSTKGLEQPDAAGTLSSTTYNTHSPLKDFTYLLTFSETVQAGSGTMTFQETSSPTTKVAVACSKTAADFTSKYVFVPVSSELKAASAYTVTVPSTCFKSTGGEMLDADKDNTFSC